MPRVTDAQRVQGRTVTRPETADHGKSATFDATTETITWATPGAGVPPGSTVTAVDLLGVNDATRVLTLAAANSLRQGLTVKNDTDQTILIKEGTGASPFSYTDSLPPGARYVLDYPASTVAITAYLAQIPAGQLLVTERQ